MLEHRERTASQDIDKTVLDSQDIDKTVLDSQDIDKTVLDSQDIEKTVLGNPPTEANATVLGTPPSLDPSDEIFAREETVVSYEKHETSGGEGTPEKKKSRGPISSSGLGARFETKVDSEYFGRYRILQKLGEGGMGLVYKAYDPDLDRVVALKVIRGDVAGPSQASRFLQEVKATARLEHPGIIRIYDSGEVPQYYFTMEYIAGKTLAQWIREEIFRCKKAARVLQSIAQAIAVAHKAKIIHRDLKPSNIMIDENGNIRVMDFGLAKIEGEASLSKTGDILGTPAYMPPEQAGSKKTDHRSDIYSLGAIGYEMITGRPVFQGENLFNVLHQVANVDPARPQSVNANVDTDLDTILLKCLEKDPDKRYQSAEELIEELDRYLADRPILAKPPTISATVQKWVKRHKELTIALSTLVLTFLGIFIFVFIQWRLQISRTLSMELAWNIMRWDMQKVSYEKDVKPYFAKASDRSCCSFTYRSWGEFCVRYAEFHPDQKVAYYKEAEEKLMHAIELNPDEYIAYYYLDIIHTFRGETAQAAEYNQKLVSTVKRHIEEKSDAMVNEFHFISYALDSMEQTAQSTNDQERASLREKTIENIEKALCYNPRLFCAYNALGLLYREKGDYATSEENFNSSLRVGPTYVPPRLNRAQLFFFKATQTVDAQEDAIKQEGKNWLGKAWEDLQMAKKLDLQRTLSAEITYHLLKTQLLLREKAKIEEILTQTDATPLSAAILRLEKDPEIVSLSQSKTQGKPLQACLQFMKKKAEKKA